MADSATPDEISLARYREYLRSLARARFDPRLRAQLDPSDIVQETLLKAHRATGEFRGRTEPQLMAWLRTILVNTLKNALRAFGRRKGEGEFSLDAAAGQSSANGGEHPEDGQLPAEEAAVRNEQLLQLTEALARLPENQRIVVEMKYLQGCPIAEICERTGRSKSSVVGLLYRGMKSLHDLLD